jgi:hypothetical protein
VTAPAGPTTAEARARLRESGPNEVAPTGHVGRLRPFASGLLSPLTLILAARRRFLRATPWPAPELLDRFRPLPDPEPNPG